MFLLLVWSCVIVSFLRLMIDPERLSVAGLSVCEIVCGKCFVDIFFLIIAVFISWFAIKEDQVIKIQR